MRQLPQDLDGDLSRDASLGMSWDDKKVQAYKVVLKENMDANRRLKMLGGEATRMITLGVSEMNYASDADGFFCCAIGKLWSNTNPLSWKKWIKAGGDPKYMKNTCSSYALIGSLIMTFSIPLLITPPDAVVEEADSWQAKVYAGCLVVTNLLATFMVQSSIVLIAQLDCCVDDEARVNFAAHYGVFEILNGLINVGAILLLEAAAVMSMLLTYDSVAVGATAAGVFLLTHLYMARKINVGMPNWNSTHNYGTRVDEHWIAIKDPIPLAAIATTEARQVLDAIGVENTTELLDFIQSSSLSPQYVPGIGRFIQPLVDVGIHRGEACTIIKLLIELSHLVDNVAD